MEAIYVECRQLRAQFIEDKKATLPEYYFTYEDGEKFLNREQYDKLQKEADAYYQKCLDERSIRVPK